MSIWYCSLCWCLLNFQNSNTSCNSNTSEKTPAFQLPLIFLYDISIEIYGKLCRAFVVCSECTWLHLHCCHIHCNRTFHFRKSQAQWRNLKQSWYKDMYWTLIITLAVLMWLVHFCVKHGISWCYLNKLIYWEGIMFHEAGSWSVILTSLSYTYKYF